MGTQIQRAIRIIAAATLLAASSAMAFAPGGVNKFLMPLFFPGAKTHKEITEDGIALIYTDLGLVQVTRSMKKAREQIADANADVDEVSKHNAPSHFDGETFSAGQALLKTLVDEVVTKLTTNNAAGARESIGKALHTVQDFYSHSNWIELKNMSPSTELARTLDMSNVAPPGAATCIDAPLSNLCFTANLNTSFLTSGYFSGEGRDKPANKCRHGGFFDKSTGFGGINKDSSICIGLEFVGPEDSPHNNDNAPATAVATQATAQLLRDIRARVTARQFKTLLGIGPTIAFAIDTTGSMGSVIPGVRSAIIDMVNGGIGTTFEPSQYILSPFNDPDVGPLTVTDDPNLFKSQVNSLFAHEGGDCPELSMQGTLNAVSASEDRGNVLVYTDASAKDAALEGAVSSLAASKNVRVYPYLFGSCSPFDPAYFSIANKTGGQVFILNSSEAGFVTGLFAQRFGEDILSVNDTVAGAMSKSIEFAIDSQIRRAIFFFSRTGTAAFSLKRPDGTFVSGTDDNVEVDPLSNGSILFIQIPPPAGTWTLQFSGDGDYSMLVTGESLLALDEFAFVTAGGRPGHEGLYPINGLPGPGVAQQAQVKFSGDVFSPRLEFRDPAGLLLSTFPLSDAAMEQGRLMADVVTPTQGFKSYLAGTDKSGFAFQRVLTTTIVPQPVSIIAPAAVDLGQGQVTTFIFQVKNDGAPDTFTFSAVDTAGFGTTISPTNATLASGATLQVRVQLTAPAGTTIGLPDALIFTASSTTRSDVRNFAVLNSGVVAPKIAGDVNRDNVVDCNDLRLVGASIGTRVGQSGFNPDVDIDSNGIIDVRDIGFVARLLPIGTVCK